MKFALAIYASPFTAQASQTALSFARALLAQGHSLYRVFFYQDGVYTGNSLATPPQDEQGLTQAWRNLAREHHLDIVVCIAAALRRGVIDPEEANRYGLDVANLAPEFSLSGLGQWVDAAVHADRLVTFGA
ncbi:sulfurtransferase complex subunit TusD [Marinimicrobium sp. ARAG 43.8]|uniref:sulfurtransferase complex subunit TusD n=1 Tax=Marinimicrobium sp. ARAG 43.8 TaxID=3418719 RepID=UPI003CEFB443